MAPTKTKTLATAPDADDVEASYNKARDTIVNKLSVPVGKLSAKDLDDIKKMMAKAPGKNADFTASFDGDWLTFQAVVGAQKSEISSVNVKALGDADKVYEILKKLAAFGLAAAPVDPEETAKKQKAVTDIENAIKSANGVKAAYEKYTFASDEPAIYGALETWATKKSQVHYLNFLGDITAKAAPQKIFDTYMKKGAKFPVNLNATITAAVEKDLAAGKAPNFAAAQKEILAVVNNKIVPAFKKETLDSMVPMMAQYNKDLAKLKQELKLVGAK